MKRQRRRLSVIAIAALLSGAIRGSNAAGQTPNRVEVRTLSLGIVSEVHQKEIEEHYRDFVGYVARKLSAASDVEAKVIIASTPPELAKLLGQQKVDFYMESTYSTYVINDVQGAGKLLLRRWQRGKPEYQSLIFTKRNSGVNRLDDLRGKIIVFEDPESTSGYFLPKFFLLEERIQTFGERPIGRERCAGRDWLYFCLVSREARRLGSDRIRRQVELSATTTMPSSTRRQKRTIGVLAQTERLPRHLVSIRKDMAPALADRLKAILLSMSEDDEGRKILQKTGETTKFDMLPEGEEGMRRRLLETFYSPARK